MTKEDLQKIIEEKNITINNQYFIDDKVLKDFDIETITNKLLTLNREQAFHLYMNLYQYGNLESTIEMFKYIIENNFDYFKSEDKKTYSSDNIIKEYTRLYSKEDYDIKKLNEIDTLNLSINSSRNFNFVSFDINYYNELIIIQKLYKEGKIKYNDILPFTNFTFELLKYHIIKLEGNYESRYDNYINEIINHIIIGNISPSQLYTCMNDYHKIKNLIVISKLGSPIYKLNHCTLDLLYTIKGKQIKNIYNDFVKTPDLEKVKNNFDYQDIIKVIVNMTSLLGYDNTNKIIRHLPNDNIKINRLFYAFLNIDLTNIKIDNNTIIYNKDFIKLIIGDNLDEPNNLLNLIYEGKTNLADKLELIYAYWDILESRFKEQPLKTKLAFLEEVLNTSRIILNPDEYKLEGDIINSYYDNQQFQKLQSINLIEEIRKEYSKMKHNYQKTIPYVCGQKHGYYYETVKANDPMLFAMGSSGDCCFKIGGDADSFVKYCAHDPNGRVLAIKNVKGKVVAMAPMVRNGNLVLCNSIESTMTNNHEFMAKMFDILEEAGNKMIHISQNSEKKDECLKALLIGSYKNDVSELNKYTRVKYGEIEEQNLYPLDRSIYANMGGFDWDNYIISSSQDFNYDSLRSFNPSTLYNDPREEVLELEKEFITDNVRKLISSIIYEKEKTTPNFSSIEKVILNTDWVIIIDNKYKLSSYIVGNDPRAEEEYNEYLALAREHLSYYDEEGNIKEENIHTYR